MRNWFRGIAALLCAGMLSLAGAAVAQTPVERHGQLSVRGNQIVDQHGEPVTLRGMSLFWAQWMPQYYNADAVRWLVADWNINLIRAAIPPAPNGYAEDPATFTAKAEAVIDAAIANGIYVIVDWHAHQPFTAEARTFFGHIAEKYGDHPNVIYEPWNEPLDSHDWVRDIKPHHEAIIPAIRAHDPDNIIVLGTSTWSQDVDEAAADPVAGANLAYTLHFYAGSHQADLRRKAVRALELGAALMVTEYGTTNYDGDGPVWREATQEWWDFMEEHHISYANWSVADKVESSAVLHPGAAGTGGWTDAMITPSGHFVRDHIRRMNGAAAGAHDGHAH